jgi:molybdenum cofactor cytidylyltransferase
VFDTGKDPASGLTSQRYTLGSMSTVAVVLAAEPGAGFEGSKYLADVDGSPMLEVIVSAVAGWPVDDVVVVLGADSDEIVERADFATATIVIDPGWSEGDASPIRAAIDLVTRDRSVDLIVLVRGDQPGVEDSVAETLIDTARSSDADAVTPKYRYATGWPVVIGPGLWDRFMSIEGNLDVHDVIVTHANDQEDVWIDHLEPKIIRVHDDLSGGR